MTCFSKQKGPSPGAVFSPGSKGEIAESHILPPSCSSFLKRGHLGKRPAEQRLGWKITFEERLPEKTRAWQYSRVRDGERERILPQEKSLSKKKKRNRIEKKTSPGKTTSDYSELPRPGARVWRSEQEFFPVPVLLP